MFCVVNPACSLRSLIAGWYISKIFFYQYVTWKRFWYLHSLNMVLFWQLFYLFCSCN
jgi:hypothetical protein